MIERLVRWSIANRPVVYALALLLTIFGAVMALRTPVEAVARRVPLWGGTSGVSADGFAIIGDAHLWLGHLRREDYTCPAPDGRLPTRESAGERLARVVCGDREMLDDAARFETLRDHLESSLLSALPGAQINGHLTRRLPQTSTSRPCASRECRPCTPSHL